jgi:hypothetical protein
MATAVFTEWPPREVTILRGRLEELTELVAAPAADVSQEVRDWLARLLVVRSCGFLEQTVVHVCRGYLAGRSGGPVRSFGHSWLERGGNPSPDALAMLTGRFDSGWANELAELLEANDQTLQREVAFLVDRRNKIAHGLNEGVGTVKALALKEVACDVGDWFVARFNPER